ncbi:MAG: mechanosensitive ion channel family protein [Xenococcaceae cyanobacterium]
MPEQTVLNLNYLWEELVKVGIVLQRSAVQIQMLGMAGSILLAWLISKWSWIQFRQRFPKVSQFDVGDSKISWRQYGAALVRYLLTPTLCLIGISLLKSLFVQQGWFAGYLSDGIELLWFYWFYRFFLVSLYALFPANAISRYHYSFFGPLFFLFAIGRILSWFSDLQRLFQVTLIELFDEPVNLKMIFVIIAGLYFLIVGTSLLEQFLFPLFLTSIGQDTESVEAASLILRYFIIGLGIVLIFGYVGVNPTALAAITGGFSVGIGFGLKEVIGNFVSGIWLLFEEALKPGDIITIDGKMSKITKLGIRATTVQVIQDNSEEIIPNQTFFTQKVSTLTGSDRLVYRSLIVGASYKCSPPKVVEILLQVAHQHPRVLKYPTPLAFALGFGDSRIDFELKFWLDDPLIGKTVTSELVCAIWQAFADNDIEIPYPQRDLHIRSDGKDFSS